MSTNKKIRIAVFLKCRYFLNRKSIHIRKWAMRPDKNEIIEKLRTTGAQYAPLTIASIDSGSGREGDLGSDAVIEFGVADGPSFRALTEIVSAATPKAISQRCAQIKGILPRSGDPALVPLIVAPYVPSKQADILARAGVSWLDLSGNMVIRASDRVYIERTGRPNQFPDTAPIKKVFQGTASLVGRALLLEPTGFTSLSQMVESIERRGARITVSTVSKVLRSLEEDLLVVKSSRSISVIEPGRLLDKLAEGWAASRNRSTTVAQGFALEDVDKVLRKLCSRLGSTYIFSGFYAAQLKGLAVSPEITMCVSDMIRFRETIESFGSDVCADEEFRNLSVIETKSQLPWFNAEMRSESRVVDDLQLYLEMTLATPRGPKVAESLRQRILRENTHG
jgi:hypothetical protein